MNNNIKNINNLSESKNILASNVSVSLNTRKTGINNNVAIIGPTGAGKSRNYCLPNILEANCSMIVSDPKGTLYDKCRAFLEHRGYKVQKLDLIDMSGNVGYNPLDCIRYNPSTKRYNEQDIITVSEIIIVDGKASEPIWDMAARMYLQSLIAYTLEATPAEDHTLTQVNKLMCDQGGKTFASLITQHMELWPDSLAAKRYLSFKSIGTADKMISSILGIVAINLSAFVFDGLSTIYSQKNKVDFAEFGKSKTALFLSVSDTDRSLDRLANLFWTQALQALCKSADKDYPDHRLKVPVRLILDDFATNVYIPDFDKITSNIRSREIYCSIILQSIAQLEALYGSARAKTIIGNCDQQLVLGIQDMDTATHYSVRANKPASYLMNMPVDKCLVFLRGQEAKMTTKFDLTSHENYRELDGETPYPDADRAVGF